MERSHDARAAAGAPGGVPAPLRDRLLLTACMFCSVAAFGFLEPFVPLFLEQSGLSRTQIGLVAAVGSGAGLLVQPLLGRLSDRIDARRPLMFAAALVAAGAYEGFRYAHGVFAFAVLTALGINSLMYLNTAAAVLVGRLTARAGGGGAAFASFRVWGSIGYVVVSLLTGLLMSQRGGSAPLSREALSPLFLFGPSLFGIVAALALFVPDPKREKKPDAEAVAAATPSENEPAALLSEAGDACDAAGTAGVAGASRGSRVCEHNLQRYLRAHFLYVFAWCGAGAYLGLYLRSLGATPLWITGVFAAGVLCEALVMSQVGRLSDRFGRRPLLAVAYVMMPIRLLLYVPATGPLWVMGVQTIHGLNFGILGAVAVAFVNDLCGEENRGASQARLAAAGGIAAALGPAAAGLIAQRFGLPAVFGAMSVVAAGGALALLWKVRESLPGRDPLHRHGPDWLRPVLRVMCLPGTWLARLPRVRARRG